jgi:ribosomal protein L7Ae-like RNA K-turn-binding protein
MRDPARALSALGMAARAGKLASGDEPVLRAIRGGKAKLVVVAADASEKAKKKYEDKCRTYGVRRIEAFDRRTLGAAIGKAERVVAAVLDAGLAALVADRLGELSEVENIEQAGKQGKQGKTSRI